MVEFLTENGFSPKKNEAEDEAENKEKLYCQEELCIKVRINLEKKYFYYQSGNDVEAECKALNQDNFNELKQKINEEIERIKTLIDPTEPNQYSGLNDQRKNSDKKEGGG